MERGVSQLPHEIIFDILSRLPVKSLCRFKSVSKSWLALITGAHFIKSHLNHQSAEADNVTHKLILASRHSGSLYPMHYPEPEHTVAELKIPGMDFADIRGSCNVVLLLGRGAELCLWNPSIRRYQKFSRPKCPLITPYTPHCVMSGLGLSGLGYDAISDDFKVVAVVRLLCDALTNVHVFSSKLSSCKRFDVTLYVESLVSPHGFNDTRRYC
ncbi:hypothetical protein RHMOL_Rhmol04G0341900 [Rhododendron molle]|uniref:Uncharacterized protein n=1 Tax=Rhododendron molle TaxID=49168 RepID=A0ACC0P8I4_RHOML|nr:hypothetical protein RHMOL_Rhmol04G0341900 [Rhododendron molle]